VPERPGPVAAKLTDFGIVAALDGTRLTATDAILGTAAYLSPEQVSGSPVGTASDVYSLGLVLLESLTGVRAFPGSLVESAVGRLNRPPRLPEDASPRLASLLAAMTALDPAARPHATEVAATLRALAGRMTGDVEATAAVPRLLSVPAGRPPAASRLVGAAAAVALVLGTGMALLADGGAPTAVPAADGTAAVAPATGPRGTALPHPTAAATARALHLVLSSTTTRTTSGTAHATQSTTSHPSGAEQHAGAKPKHGAAPKPEHAAPPKPKHAKAPHAASKPPKPGHGEHGKAPKPGKGGHGKG
jgi:hypothetical protein